MLIQKGALRILRIQIKISCANEVYNEEDTSLLAKPATYSQILVGGIGVVSYEYRKAWRGDYFCAAPLYSNIINSSK
jgi:hypothetical protein